MTCPDCHNEVLKFDVHICPEDPNNKFCGDCGFNIGLHRAGVCPTPVNTTVDTAAAPRANTRQVGVEDYAKGGYGSAAIQHWDFAAANDMDYFQGAITKYVTRWKQKAGLKDLHKALHYLEKYIEVETEKSRQFTEYVRRGPKEG